MSDTRGGINGLVSMRWVFSGAADVTAHAKSGITRRQTRSLPVRRAPAGAVSEFLRGDKWRTPAAECTHSSGSITLSQHRSSKHQSASAIYANRHESANICAHARPHRHPPPLFCRRFLRAIALDRYLFVVVECVCVCVFLLHFHHDISLTGRKSL